MTESPAFHPSMDPSSGFSALSALRLHWIRVPLHEPFRISSGEVSIRDSILVELEAEGAGGSSSQTGWGEASPLPGAFYSSETPEATGGFLVDCLAPRFLGRPGLDPRPGSGRFAGFSREPFAEARIRSAGLGP